MIRPPRVLRVLRLWVRHRRIARPTGGVSIAWWEASHTLACYEDDYERAQTILARAIARRTRRV